MSIFTNLLKKVASTPVGNKIVGGVGKAITTAGNLVSNNPSLGISPGSKTSLQLAPGGLGAQLQSLAGYLQPTVYAAEPVKTVSASPQYSSPIGPQLNTPTKPANADPIPASWGQTVYSTPSGGSSGNSGGGTTGNGASGTYAGSSAGEPINLQPPVVAPDTSAQDLALLKQQYDLSRQGIEAQGAPIETAYTTAKTDIQGGITDSTNAGETQKANLRQTYGDLLKNQLQTYQDLGRQRQGTFAGLGTLDSSSYGEQQFRSDQALADQRNRTETQQVQDVNSVDTEVGTYTRNAQGELAKLATQYQSGKDAIALSLAQNNLDEAAAIKSAMDQISQRATDIKNSIVNFANQAALLKTQGVNVRTNIGGITGSDFVNQQNQALQNITASGNSTYTPTTTAGTASGWIAPDGTKYKSYSDFLRAIGAQ